MDGFMIYFLRTGKGHKPSFRKIFYLTKELMVIKNYFLLISLLGALFMGCAGSQARLDSNMPEWLDKYPPEEVIWGIGSAKQSSDNLSMSMAESRARQNIAFQVSTQVQAMITDYARDAGATNNQASLNLAETVGRQLTQAQLNGVNIVERWKAPDGAWWYLLEYKKADAARAAADIIDSEAARYAEFKALEALKLMDAQLSKTNVKPVPVTE
jgi:hypothetical protein